MEKPIILVAGIIFGAFLMFLAVQSDLKNHAQIIANLEKKANSVPIVTVDTLGICKVAQGGKSYMLIDVTEELKAFDVANQPIEETKE